jgi:hypothetical protein
VHHIGREPFEREVLLVRRFGRAGHATLHPVAIAALRHKERNQRVGESLRFAGVVVLEIADVHVERDSVKLRPRVYREVRFSQQYEASDTARLVFKVRKLMKVVAHHSEPRAAHKSDAGFLQDATVNEQIANACTLKKISGKVDALHLYVE